MRSRLMVVSCMAKKDSDHHRVVVQKIKTKVAFVFLECFHYSIYSHDIHNTVCVVSICPI